MTVRVFEAAQRLYPRAEGAAREVRMTVRVFEAAQCSALVMGGVSR